MTQNLSPQHVVLFLGTALVIGGLMVLIIFALHRLLHRERREMNLKPGAPCARDEATFLIASMQGVVANLRSREKELETLLHNAEQRAESSTRALEVLVHETRQVLMVFDREGFLTLASPAARTVLEVDTWSRRRYSEILGSNSPLASAIGMCLKSGKGSKQGQLIHTSPSGRKAVFGLSLAPYHGRSGKIAGVVCLIAAQPPQAAR